MVSHATWGLVGIVLAASLLLLASDDSTVSVIAAVLLFVTIGSIFVLWNRLGGRGFWVGLLTCGLLMSATLTYATVARVGCPPSGEKILLKAGKPPVSCDEVRAGYLAMASFFYVITLVGLAAPYVARRQPAVVGSER